MVAIEIQATVDISWPLISKMGYAKRYLLMSAPFVTENGNVFRSFSCFFNYHILIVYSCTKYHCVLVPYTGHIKKNQGFYSQRAASLYLDTLVYKNCLLPIQQKVKKGP